jgi:nicotinamidase-related amidase
MLPRPRSWIGRARRSLDGNPRETDALPTLPKGDAMTPRSTRLLDPERSALMVIDLQESYRGKLHQEELLVKSTSRLLSAAAELGIPVSLTEQYPKGLGRTRADIASHLPPDCARFEKTSFSCLGADGLLDHLRSLNREQVVLVGIETHVCVGQSGHDLLAEGFQVHAVRDAISARFPLEDETGFRKLVESGAIPTSVEAALFEWLRDSRNPLFKAVQKLVV